MSHGDPEQAVPLADMPPLQHGPGPMGSPRERRVWYIGIGIMVLVVILIMGGIWLDVRNKNADAAAAADAQNNVLQAHLDTLRAQCIVDLEGRLNSTLPSTLSTEYRIWLRLCMAAREYDPEHGPMTIEVKAWYDGTAEDILTGYLMPKKKKKRSEPVWALYSSVGNGGTGMHNYMLPI